LIPEAGVYLASAGGGTVYTADVTGKQATTNVDFNMSYNLSDQITLTFAAINLTDQFDDVYGDSTIMATNKYTHTGREYTLGARYKF
jgi:outer membrane receptor protein involved in Fe transport